MDMPDEATLSVELIHPHGLQVRNEPLKEATRLDLLSSVYYPI
jgi:hypothetical protein